MGREIINNDIPEELQVELSRLQKKEKIYTWVVVGALSVAVMFGINWFRAQGENDYSQYSYGNSAGFVSNSGAAGAGGGCCSPGGGTTPSDVSSGFVSNNSAAGAGGGCCSTGGGAGAVAADLSAVEVEGLAFYQETYKDQGTNVSAEVKDYGCHIQCDIVSQDGEIIKSFSYRNGEFFEI